ncbi:substrate-binding periplasmic protein [Shewanella algae]|uniref:substrate-binding periplasmic protein n=1 Tax=Shewanella algae TaxID=38313 RepID=UPI0030062955
MKKLLSSVLLGLSCLISAQASTLKIAFFDFAPYSFQEEGELKGVMVEMTRLACQRWEEGCQLKLWRNRRARQQMNSGETGAMGLAWADYRTSQYYFSVPLLQSEYGFFSLKALSLKQMQQLSDQRVAVFSPSNTHNALQKLNQELIRQQVPPMQVVTFPQSDELPLKMLARKRFDAYFVNRDVGRWYAGKQGIEGLDYLPSQPKTYYCLAFDIRHNDRQTIARFNRLLLELQQGEAWHQLLQRWQVEPAQWQPEQAQAMNIPLE